MAKIDGGYVLTARAIRKSNLSSCSPVVRELWSYLYEQANHKDGKYRGYSIKRGQLFRDYKDIREELSWNVGYRKKRYTEDAMKKAMAKLRELLMVTTTRAPGGVLITICNYDLYQTPSNYEGTSEGTIEGTNEAPMKHQGGAIYNKNVEEGKKKKKVKKKKPSPPKPLAPEATRIAQTLASEILKRDPGYGGLQNGKSEGAIKRWASDIEKVQRLDGRTWEQIEWMMQWCQNDIFWQSNILSGATFRKKFDQMVARATQDAKTKQSSSTDKMKQMIIDLEARGE